MNSANKDAGAADAISLLTADHQKVRRLFEQFEELRSQGGRQDLKSELVEEICFELTLHAMVEEELFYPAVRAAIDDDELMDEAEAEHAGVKDLIKQLEEMEPGDTRLDATVTVLAEQVERHVAEEENNMFIKVRQVQLDIKALGRKIKDRKDEIESDFDAAPEPAQVRGGADAQGKPGSNV